MNNSSSASFGVFFFISAFSLFSELLQSLSTLDASVIIKKSLRGILRLGSCVDVGGGGLRVRSGFPSHCNV